MAEGYQFTNGDGVVTDLSVQDGILYPTGGLDGRFMPPSLILSSGVPDYDGERYRGALHQPRIISLPVIVVGTSKAQVRSRMRDLASALNCKKDLGQFQVSTEDGITRVLNCIYAGGLDGAEGSAGGVLFQRTVLTFRAPDPYWYDTAVTSLSYTGSDPISFFPIFPLRLSSSSVFAQPTVPNAGDVDASPIWQITGPGSAFAFTNLATGETLSIDTTLVAGESITIDTRFGKNTITKNDGTNLWDDATGDMWQLAPGNNNVEIAINGTNANSVVQVYFTPKFVSV